MEGRKSFVDEFFPRNIEVTGKDSEWSVSWRKTEVDGCNSRGTTAKKSGKPLNLYELPESCLMSSSVYYGGRDDYISQTPVTNNSGAHYSYKMNNKEDDLGNSEVATRGDWWQGSYYY